MPRKSGPQPPDFLDKALVRAKFIEPGLTNAALGARFGLTSDAISKRLRKADVIALYEKMHTDIYEQGKAIRELALTNALAYAKNPESKEGFEITKMFAQAVADAPATMPDAPGEVPEFYDPDEDNNG